MQDLLGLLDNLSTWLPVVGLALLAAAVAISRDRRRWVLVSGLAVAGSMLLLGATLNVIRPFYLDALPESSSAAAAGAIYDQLVSFIRLALRGLGIVALTVAVVAWFSARRGAGASARAALVRGIDGLRRGTARAGLQTGKLGVALGAVPRPDPGCGRRHRGRRLPRAGPPDRRYGVGVRAGDGRRAARARGAGGRPGSVPEDDGADGARRALRVPVPRRPVRLGRRLPEHPADDEQQDAVTTEMTIAARMVAKKPPTFSESVRPAVMASRTPLMTRPNNPNVMSVSGSEIRRSSGPDQGVDQAEQERHAQQREEATVDLDRGDQAAP